MHDVTRGGETSEGPEEGDNHYPTPVLRATFDPATGSSETDATSANQEGKWQMSTTTQSALIAEGRSIIERTEEDSWRLAEIVHQLHEDGMTYQAIANEFGWSDGSTAAGYKKAHDLRHVADATRTFADAIRLSMLSEDRAAATQAIAEADGVTVGTASNRPPQESKAIAAVISDLPPEEKKAVARELAVDDQFRSEVREADDEHRSRAIEGMKRDVRRRRVERGDAPKADEPIGDGLAGALVANSASMAHGAVEKLLKDVSGYDAGMAEGSEARKITLEYIDEIRSMLDEVTSFVTGDRDWNKALEELGG